MTRADSHWLGWNPIEIWRGTSLFQSERQRVDLGWQPGDIRNCSYAAAPGWIGVSAEDRTNGGVVLAIHELGSGKTRVLLRLDSLLHHALNRSGSKVCYTQASQGAGAADLFVFDTADAQARLLLTGGVAHGSTPAWFPDDTRIAYHTAQGQIEVFDSAHGRSEVVTDGEAPAIRADGERIAFRRAHEIFVRDQAGDVQPVSPSSVLAKPHLADGLSWAEDGAHLSFGHTAGLVGKRTDFYLLDVATRQAQKADLDYLSGLILT